MFLNTSMWHLGTFEEISVGMNRSCFISIMHLSAHFFPMENRNFQSFKISRWSQIDFLSGFKALDLLLFWCDVHYGKNFEIFYQYAGNDNPKWLHIKDLIKIFLRKVCNVLLLFLLAPSFPVLGTKLRALHVRQALYPWVILPAL